MHSRVNTVRRRGKTYRLSSDTVLAQGRVPILVTLYAHKGRDAERSYYIALEGQYVGLTRSMKAGEKSIKLIDLTPELAMRFQIDLLSLQEE